MRLPWIFQIFNDAISLGPFPPYLELQIFLRIHGIPSLVMLQSFQPNVLQFNQVSATHRTLGIAEILGLVFEQLRFMGRFDTLKSVCLVCQAFKDPALDVIWFHLHGLIPLLSILPLERNGDLLVSRHHEFLYKIQFKE